MNEFKFLSSKEEQALSREELLKYYEEARNYLKESEYLYFSEKGVQNREKLNPGTREMLSKIFKYDVNVLGLENIPEGPVIFACSHQDFNDITNSVYANPRHALTLNASTVRWIIKVMLYLNGAIFVERENKDSRRMSKEEMERSLAKGRSINMYPEATLNCTPSKLHLPFFIGMIDMAKKMGVPVIPVVQEYTYDDTKLDGKTHVKSVDICYGRPIYVNVDDDRLEKLAEFDEVFSTIRWDLIEKKGNFKRKDIPKEYYPNFIKTRIRDWKIPGNDIKEERKQVYRWDDEFYLFHHVNDVEFDDDNNLLDTEYVRFLNELYDKHLKDIYEEKGLKRIKK